MEPVQTHHSLVRELWRWWGCRLSPIRLPFSSHTHRHTLFLQCWCLSCLSILCFCYTIAEPENTTERASGKQDEDRNTSTAACILISTVMWCTFNPQGKESVWECSHLKKGTVVMLHEYCLNSCKTLIYLTSPSIQQLVTVTKLNLWGL